MTKPPTYDDIVEAASRLKGVAARTPLLEAALLNERAGARIIIKAEMLQKTGAFKLRGAWNRISRLSEAEKKRGVLCYSSGNHAQAVAASATLAGTSSIVVMPATAPALKVARCRAFGATVVLHEGDRHSMVARATEMAETEGRVLVPPFDDPFVIAGQGTVGLEIAEDLTARGIVPDVVLVPCGGGGLMAGTATAIKMHFPAAALYGVEPAGFDDTARSLVAGERVANEPGAHSICDALLVPEPGVLTFAVNAALLSGGVAVSDDEVRDAMAAAFEHLKVVTEPGGAVALAAVLSGKLDLKGKTVVVVASGGNVDAATFAAAITRKP
ncbi:MAG: threonine/serine dehydratase [Proteobacteria bacterium]|nr:threonine/serine dehydratase [Pseudomonadota bacterium]MDA1058917.1 threonine/serine dehydratase [Pseudomonadota bacterium]